MSRIGKPMETEVVRGWRGDCFVYEVMILGVRRMF